MGLWDVLTPLRTFRPRAFEQGLQNSRSDVLISQVKKKKKSEDFLKVTFCGQSGIVPGAHSYMTVAASAGCEFQESGVYSRHGEHTHFPGPLMITKRGEAYVRVSH